ncbi:MFS transporter [Arthrobacter sp. zg-Y20]|uniref:uridine transporter UriT n=1 Tax=unclassified Arthrobacter TaxID=235627 RepID=UPI001D1428D4|nr:MULTISPECIES: MFS transporter [unclassified Arthrobacter]MCC3276720.1 MFS transporter [Arthrobacter sp. zg-Y20]MDK1316879.1 MFS transporter [Arthrobacter sp. zg.Y20]WIB07753.1 MFS transporter [Arthrobacter sp. zg-Y20]
MAALLAACVAFQLNASMLSPALVTIEEELDTTSAAVGLTQTAFFTAAALFSLFLPRLGDIIGRKKVLSGMLVVLTLGSVVAALAPNIEVLFLARLIQGVSGPVVPLTLIMLRVEIRDAKLYGTLMGVITAVNGGIAGIDAVAGGYLAQNHGFSSVFWAMAAVGAVATALLLFLAPESRAEKKEKMDWVGVVPLVISVGTLLTAFNEAGKLAAANWPLVIGLMAVAVVAFAVFWKVENRTEQPLVATYLLKRRSTWALLLTTLLTMTGVFAIMNGILPALAQDGAIGFGMGAEESAWWTLTPYAIAGLVLGPIAGRLAASWGYGKVLRIGMIGSVIALALVLLVVGSDSKAGLLGVSVLIGITYAGIGNIMLNGLGIVLSPKENPGFLPGLNAGAFNLGAGLSFAVIYAVKTAATPADGGAGGYYGGIVAGLVILVLALAASFLIPKPAAAEVAAAAPAAR